MANKSSLDNLLKSLVSVANIEQNNIIPPNIYSSMYNTVTSFLIDECVKRYPEFVDVLLPFIKEKKIPVTDGYVQLPEDYRNLIGAPSISVKADGSDCSDSAEPINTEAKFKVETLKKGCQTVPVVIVDKSEWDNLTTSTYDFPTYNAPIGMFIGGNRIKVCPFDIKNVQVTYAKKEDIYVYGYTMQPDDTYIYNVSDSVESIWTEAAYQYLFKGLVALYSAYSKDNNLRDFGLILNQSGIL